MTKKINACFEWLFFGFLLSLAIFIALSGKYSATVLDGINLFIASVLPALFPYFFITAILSAMSVTAKFSHMISPLTTRLFNVGGQVGYAFFMSVLCGYPVGAKTVCDLTEKNILSPSESVRASCLCSTSSPVFMISAVGNIMFKNSLFGLLLFCTHFISAILTGIIFSFYKRKERPNGFSLSQAQKVDNILYNSAYSAVISSFVVGSIITIFYLFTQILYDLKVLTPLISVIEFITGDKATAQGIVYGLFECTKGLKTLSQSGITTLSLPVSCALCSFGGLSVLFQSLSYLKKAKIKTAPFILSKIISAVISFFMGLAFSFLL